FTIVALPQIARYGTLAAARYGPRVVEALGHGGVVVRRLPPRPRRLPAVALALIAAAVAAVVAPRLSPSHTAGVEAATEPVAAAEEVGWHSLCHDAAAGAVVIAAGPMPAPDAPIPDATAAPAC